MLPKRLLDDYQASIADPDRLVLDAEIAIIDARVNDLLQLVDTGESGRLWSELQKQWMAFQAAEAAKAKPDADQAKWRVGQLITEGMAEWTAWNDVISLIDRRRKLVESERKRLVQAQKLVTTDQALALLASLVDAVRRHVSDDAVLRAITNEYARLVGQPSPAATLPEPQDTRAG